MAHLQSFTLTPRSAYVRELRPELPESVFRPARSRLLLVPVYLACIATGIVTIHAGWGPWPIAILASLGIGLAFAGLTFVAHEVLHGAVVRDRRAMSVVGWIAFLPFVLSPRLWLAWHTRVHHGNTNHDELDPDAYARLAEYRTNRRVRFFIDYFSIGRRRWRGVLSLVLGFTVQAATILATARRRGILSARDHRLALAETALGVVVWGVVAAVIGGGAFVLAYVVPLLVANSIVMAYILTNHSLSPLATVNDPLVTGLSVTNARWIEWLTLRFGFHVEHHLFPAMSSRHAPHVRSLIEARWPERYQSMPLWRALLRLHRTARVYKDDTTLIDPATGREFPTLVPR